MIVIEYFFWLLSFMLFTIIQAVIINGIRECFQPGQVFNLIAPAFFKKNMDKKWAKPLFSCVKCMASVWGTITFWGTVLLIFGFHPIQIWVWIWDLFILVVVNFQIYKRA